MSLKEFSAQATLYKDDTVAIEQTLLLNERDDGKLHAQRITRVNGVEAWNNQVLFSVFEAGKSMDEAMTDIQQRWDEVERGELQFMCKNAVLYGRVKQIEPSADYMATLLKGTLISYYTMPDMMAVENPEYDSNDRYALGVQFRSFRHSTNIYRNDNGDGDGAAQLPITDRYENAMLRIDGAAENIMEFMNADIWGESIHAPGTTHEGSSYDYELQGGEKRDMFEEYKDPGEPDVSRVVPLEDDDIEVGDDFFSGGEEEYDEDRGNEYDLPEVNSWEQEAQRENSGGGYEVGEQTPMMRLVPEVSDRMFELVEQLTKAWVMIAQHQQKGHSLGDEPRAAIVEALNEAIRETREAATKFGEALAEEGKGEFAPRLSQLVEEGWRNEGGVEVKGLLKVAEQMRDMVKTKRADTYIAQGREGPTPGTGDLPKF